MGKSRTNRGAARKQQLREDAEDRREYRQSISNEQRSSGVELQDHIVEVRKELEAAFEARAAKAEREAKEAAAKSAAEVKRARAEATAAKQVQATAERKAKAAELKSARREMESSKASLHMAKVTVETDSQSAHDLCHRHTVGQNSRHVERKVFKMRELQHKGVVVVRLVPTAENGADMFTKVLDTKTFTKHRREVMNLPAK